ncbi:hypothetical protein [Bacillus sp. CECT 9360]|uniref:hypothetical protein n=1 Tax=Bacillus sp. CECT 9360 TaxID=2845821 RepID=UPI001E38BAC6|nr:hypothetical protein [Bacillus sp. CECT 9360]CAH0346009.1 hypothetical protein BCI9360_02319 [Bacillus sp. CECT 9360]
MIKCPYCNEEKNILFRMPVEVITDRGEGEEYYKRSALKIGGLDKICFDCLKSETEEDL